MQSNFEKILPKQANSLHALLALQKKLYVTDSSRNA